MDITEHQFSHVFLISICLHRHPDHAYRPTFLSLLKALTNSPSKLLSWSLEDTKGVAQVSILGGPLDAGRKLYPDLQDVYIVTRS